VLGLLNPRILIGIALLAGLAFTHFTAYRHGKGVVRHEWEQAKAAALEESVRLERARQSRVDEAARSSAARSVRIAADDSRVVDAVRGLRSAVSARKLAEESAAAAAQRADTLGELLVQGAEAHRELAQRCDRHVNDVKTLLEAWPQ
jgi:Tfp pilus assembly protein PilE